MFNYSSPASQINRANSNNFFLNYIGRIGKNLKRTFLGVRDTGLAVLGIELPNSYRRTPKELRPYERQNSPRKQSDNLVPELDPVLSSFPESDLSDLKIQRKEKQQFGELMNQIKAEKNNSFNLFQELE